MEIKICPFCKREMDFKRLPRHIKCCVKNPENIASEDPIEITEQNLEKVKALPKSLKRKQSVTYTCLNCGERVLLKSFNNFKSFSTCPKCTRKVTCQERYGGNAPCCSKRSTEKLKATLAKRTKEEIEASNNKRKETCQKKYGVDAVAQDPVIRAKQVLVLESKTKEEKIAIQQKRAKTMQEKYGEKYALRIPSFKEKAKENYTQTCLEKYGMKHAPKSSYTYKGEKFDSGWELAVYIWATENSIPIRRLPISFEYEFEGKKHTYYPDFEIEGKLVEVKGNLFFEGEKMINPFDHTKDLLVEAKHQCGLKNGVEFWSGKEMQPILEYVEGKYTKDFIPLFKNNLPFPYPKNCLHKSIYSASKYGKLSPFEAWSNKDLILKSALNRLKYKGRCKPSDIIQGFTIANIAPKVSVFKVETARKLIEKYLNEFEEIFDPFSGFSGRMLGAAFLGKKYIGQDINKTHVEESNKIIKSKGIETVEVKIQDILTDVPQIHECLFTCPPYGKKEKWNEVEVEKSCDEWIEICLKKYKCKKYLFVVDTTEKYKEKIVEEIANKSHFGESKELVLLFQ